MIFFRGKRLKRYKKKNDAKREKESVWGKKGARKSFF
jgi:hypothetical protein